MQQVDISKVSAVSQQLHLVAEFQLKECAGIIIGIAALNRVAQIILLVHTVLSAWKWVKSFSSKHLLALNQDLHQFSLTILFKHVFTFIEVVLLEEREKLVRSDPTTQGGIELFSSLEPPFLKLSYIPVNTLKSSAQQCSHIDCP